MPDPKEPTRGELAFTIRAVIPLMHLSPVHQARLSVLLEIVEGHRPLPGSPWLTVIQAEGDFGQQVRLRLKHLGLTTTQFGARIGRTESSVRAAMGSNARLGTMQTLLKPLALALYIGEAPRETPATDPTASR